ncbi:hypothetical protein ABMA27_011291, partial [Loxostege sticticalis]
MVHCLVIVTIIVLPFGDAIDSVLTFSLDDVVSWTDRYNEVNVHINEGDTLHLTFTIGNNDISHASCKHVLSNLKIDLSSAQHGKLQAIFHGEDSYEGIWNCTFTRTLGAVIQGYSAYIVKRYEYLNCSITVKITRLILTVTRSDSKYSVQAKTTELAYYDYETGERVIFNCEKSNNLKPEPLMVTFCTKKLDYCETFTEVKNIGLTLYENNTQSELSCNRGREKSGNTIARVVFRLKPALVSQTNYGVVVQNT